jgi:large subunit ribosomal protein L7/L12
MSDQDLLEGIAARRALSGGGGSNDEVVEVVAAEPVKEKEFFDIKLTAVDPKSKIKIIKEVRALTGLGLKEVSVHFFANSTSFRHILSWRDRHSILQAKDLVEKAPVVIKQGIKKEELEAMKKILLDVGAEIEII